LQVVRVVLAVLSLPLVHRLMLVKLEALEVLVEWETELGQPVELVEPPRTLEALVAAVELEEQKMELGLLW
jgi:hypothetical protein